MIEEWTATYELLQKVKRYLDQLYKPSGYNLGWNCRATYSSCTFSRIAKMSRFNLSLLRPFLSLLILIYFI